MKNHAVAALALALAACIVIVALSGFPRLVFAIEPEWFAGKAPGLWNPALPVGTALGQQLLIAGLVLVAMRLIGASDDLALGPAKGGTAQLINVSGGTTCIMIVLGVLAGHLAAARFLNIPSTSLVGLNALTLVIGTPFAEELLCRGMIFPALQRLSLGAIGAAVISSAIWAGLHPGLTLVSMTLVFAFGLLLVYARVRTGSLWAPILAHAVFNLIPALVPVVFWTLQGHA